MLKKEHRTWSQENLIYPTATMCISKVTICKSPNLPRWVPVSTSNTQEVALDEL